MRTPPWPFSESLVLENYIKLNDRLFKVFPGSHFLYCSEADLILSLSIAVEASQPLNNENSL